jgi:hypothetical protein
MESRAVEPITEQTLLAVEWNLHAVIRGRAAKLIDQYNLPLPSLAAMLAGAASDLFRPAYQATDGTWFYQVPGMYGGFRLRWLTNRPLPTLESVSFCRIAGGSAQRHEITPDGSTLVESGMF